jgi:hypothetical protein
MMVIDAVLTSILVLVSVGVDVDVDRWRRINGYC